MTLDVVALTIMRGVFAVLCGITGLAAVDFCAAAFGRQWSDCACAGFILVFAGFWAVVLLAAGWIGV